MSASGMFTGIVHKDRRTGTIWFDDVPVRGPKDVPRRRCFEGTLFYATPSVLPSDLGRLCRGDDVAFGPAPGKVLGVKFRVGKRRRMRVMSTSAWGVDRRNPNTAYERLQWLFIEALAAGLRPRPSVAGTALGAYMDRFDGRQVPELVQLPCRFRGVAHAALHGGPVAVLRAGAEHAVQIDVRRAYLSALYQPFPVHGVDGQGQKIGGWHGVSDVPWERVRERTGFVDAVVEVELPPEHASGLPPLPVHLPQGAVHATGRLRGVWTIAQVRAAEERGEVTVQHVHQCMWAVEVRPIFARLADFFGALPEQLGKRLYTRFWGRLGYRGGYVGTPSETPVRGAVPSTRLWWRYSGTDLADPHAPRSYRPDLAAMVAATNHQHVIATVRRLAPGSVIAAHVDAIWTTDTAGATALEVEGQNRSGTWRSKREGKLRFYGPGCYTQGDKIAASGYDASVFGPLTQESLVSWVSGSVQRRLTMQTRRWTADPVQDIDATSRPVRLEMDVHHQPSEGPPIGASCWTRTGWMREREQLSGPVEAR